jgi:N-acetyl-anhydromuramyl-L-alanine amidase AmpD
MSHLLMRNSWGMLAVALVLATTGSLVGIASAQVINNNAEKNEPTITKAGSKATPTTAVASGQPSSQGGVSANNQKTEEQGWLSIATHLPSAKDGDEMTQPLIGTLIHSTRWPSFNDANKQNAQTGPLAWHFTVDRDGQIYQHLSLKNKGIHAGDAEMALPTGGTTKQVNSRTIGIELVNLGGTVKFLEGANLDVKWRNVTEPKSDCDTGQVVTPVKFSNALTVSSSVVSRMKIAGPKVTVEGAEYDAYWEEYPAVQIDALVTLLKAMQQTKWKAAVSSLVAHAKVARCPVGRKLDPGPLFPADRLSGFNYLQ